MLKLIALRPLPGCRKSALKCLQVGQMYYLCNDFRISDDRVSLRDEYVRPLPLDFFSLSKDASVSINISAVVGMNGDGKSSLIELMMRLLNNCAKHYRLTYKDKLLRIEGIKAELYYLLDDIVYCIRESNEYQSTSLLKCADIRGGGREWIIEEVEQLSSEASVNKMKKLFYTIISNYSLYAYNIMDLREEWDNTIRKEEENWKCWLHYLFHKNDGYRTPMTIHPYRNKGIIDINKENELTLPRLAALYIQEPDALDNHASFRWMGEKYAYGLLLSDPGYSKLQEKTIIDFFRDVKKVSMLQGTIKEIDAVANNFNSILWEGLIDDSFDKIESCLDYLTGSFIEDGEYRIFIDAYMEWSSDRKGLYSRYSDIALLLRAMVRFNDEPYLEKTPYATFDRKFRPFARLGVKQLVRLRMVYEVFKAWKFPTDKVFCEYGKLNEIDKCRQYVVYKTISICETYPAYIGLMEKKGKAWKGMPTSSAKDVIGDIIRKIKREDSHITLKIRQCLKFIESLEKQADFLQMLTEVSLDKNDRLPGLRLIPFERLKKHFRQKDTFPLQLLPPPIFKSEIIYRTTENKESEIPYAYLSSGEKQLLNNIGVLLYHLRNLDSVVEEEWKSRNVNIILEEIELYFHPEYQRLIVKMLIEKLHGAKFKNIKNINITFVTHSPFILSDIPMCNVLLLKDGRPSTKGMQENTFGANIHGMLKNGFFLPSLPIGEFAHEKINTLFQRLNGYKLDAGNKEQREWFYSNIMRVGEPYIREQLMKLFSMHYPPHYYD